ncbi:hypothetical protein AGMMS49992_30940 [Clostridia bacterium]|nr:hypothetical protein AGMMS49992_30940 [Clostridia bacterium]
MISDNVYTIAQIRTLFTPVFQQYGVKKAILFGSYAKGRATRLSDIDLVVDSRLYGFKFYGFADSLERTIDKHVDVFDIIEINHGSNIEKEIAGTGVVLYEQ